MKFIRFPSFVNHTDKAVECMVTALPPMKWYCSEKIDGTNMSLMIDVATGTVAAGRREAVLLPTEKFFGGWQQILKDNTAALHALAAVYPTAKQIHVFGEYFGTGVLNRVFYTAGRSFRAFDVALVQSDGTIRWLPVSEWTAVLDTVGISRVHFCKEGTLEECLAFDTHMDSTVPATLGETVSGRPTNICEGYVLRSEETLFIRPTDGSVATMVPKVTESSWTRSMIKKKNTEFSEYSASVAKSAKAWSVAVEPIHTAVLTRLNNSRALSVRSKMLDTEAADRRKFAKAILADAIKEVEEWLTLSEKDREELTKDLLTAAFKAAATAPVSFG